MSKNYIKMPEIPSFSHLSLSAFRTLITPTCVVSCHLACALLSLLISSYLPALALSNDWNLLLYVLVMYLSPEIPHSWLTRIMVPS